LARRMSSTRPRPSKITASVVSAGVGGKGIVQPVVSGREFGQQRISSAGLCTPTQPNTCPRAADPRVGLAAPPRNEGACASWALGGGGRGFESGTHQLDWSAARRSSSR
jgi:hypothetical protein